VGAAVPGHRRGVVHRYVRRMLLEVALRVSPVGHYPRDQAVGLVDRGPWVVDEATLHRSPLLGVSIAGLQAQLAERQLPAALDALLQAALGLVAVAGRLHDALVLLAEPGAEQAPAPVAQPGRKSKPQSYERQDYEDRDDDRHRGHASPPCVSKDVIITIRQSISKTIRLGNQSGWWPSSLAHQTQGERSQITARSPWRRDPVRWPSDRIAPLAVDSPLRLRSARRPTTGDRRLVVRPISKSSGRRCGQRQTATRNMPMKGKMSAGSASMCPAKGRGGRTGGKIPSGGGETKTLKTSPRPTDAAQSSAP